MPRPVNVMTFGAVKLNTPSDWSGKSAISTGNPYEFTDVLQDYTLPVVRLAVVRIGSSRANYPIRGMLEDMTAALTLTGHTPAVVGQAGAYLEFVFEADIEDDGTNRGDIAVAEIKGWCNGYEPGQVQGPYSQPQTNTVEIQVTKYKLSIPGLGGTDMKNDLYDINLDLDKYERHGVSLWTAKG